MERAIVVVLAWALAAAAFALGLKERRVARAVAAWPRVQGRLVTRDVVPSAVGSTGAAGARYTAAVRYEYEVDGRAYTGDRLLAHGTVSGMRDHVQRTVDALGETVDVRYDPADPADACLMAQPGWWVPGLFGASAFAFVVGLVALV